MPDGFFWFLLEYYKICGFYSGAPTVKMWNPHFDSRDSAVGTKMWTPPWYSAEDVREKCGVHLFAKDVNSTLVQRRRCARKMWSSPFCHMRVRTRQMWSSHFCDTMWSSHFCDTMWSSHLCCRVKSEHIMEDGYKMKPSFAEVVSH